MADDKPKKAGMRRMHEAILRSGVMARLGSEARLVLCYAICWADYTHCTFTISARGAAKVCGCQTTTFRRGIAELQAAGVISPGPKTKYGRSRFVFQVPPSEGAHVACPGARTLRARGRAHYVSGGAHVACQERARSVSGARTLRAPYPEKVPSGPEKDQRRNQEALAASAAVAAAARPDLSVPSKEAS